VRKERIQEAIASLPDEVDVDLLIEKLYLLNKLENAERQLAAGEGIAHEEVKKRLASWLE